MDDILQEIGPAALRRYLKRCSEYVSFDVDRAFVVARDSIRKHNGSQIPDSAVREMVALEQKWYQSLRNGEPDYSVYDSPFYFIDVWVCWVAYSRKYLKTISSPTSLSTGSIVDSLKENVKGIVDLGCGFGYTTAALAKLFPDASVRGTNLPGTAQYDMACGLADFRNFTVSDSFTGPADLVFASEYFEHIEAPLEHLQNIIEECQPKCFIVASTFTKPAIGHFEKYRHAGMTFQGKSVGRMFGKVMRGFGYEKVETNCWNSRPALWRRK